MKITKEKVIPGKIELNSEELDIVVDFKILLERVIRVMDNSDILRAGKYARSDVVDLLDTVNDFYAAVGIDYSVDEMVIRRADNDASIKD